MPPATPSGADPRVGTLLRGKYRLDRVIGTGGMAIVYKATHRNHAEFAVKMLHPELSVVADIRARFVREGYAANAVKHPGAVRVVDDDVAEDGAAFLVMELLDGLPGDRFWGSVGRKVPVEIASAIAIQLLEVLAAAHDKGIVHRDIKPANLFLTRDGTVKVLDFGIARAREAIVGAHAHATGSGMTLGTPAFMAPEHARGRAREIDGRSDLWAVGATFFAMVSGELVHAAETPNEFLIAAGTKPARSLAAAAPDVPASFVAVMDRALAFERGDRWPTATAMGDALREAHRAAFGGDDLELVIAAAIKDQVPPPEAAASSFPSPIAETRTSDVAPARVPTERFSTSAAIARDRDSLRPRSSRWALVVGALVVAALAATVWLKARSAAPPAVDAGVAGPFATPTPDAMATRPLRADVPPPDVPATGAPASPEPQAPPPIDPPPGPAGSHASPLPAARHRAPRDAGAPASCSPPWFLDSVGHKQYKPECI